VAIWYNKKQPLFVVHSFFFDVLIRTGGGLMESLYRHREGGTKLTVVKEMIF
jgi:hypothetical protein